MPTCCVDLQPAFLQRVDVARHHADAVRVVAAQVGLDQVARDQVGLALGRAAGRDDGVDRGVSGSALKRWVSDTANSVEVWINRES